MNNALPDNVLEQINREQAHFSSAAPLFFHAWKRGVEIAGPQWFGDGSREGLNRASSIWDLRPNLPMISEALDVLSRGERLFLVVMAGFYNAHDSAPLLKRCGFEGLSDLGGLDLERRKVIANLLLLYNGW